MVKYSLFFLIVLVCVAYGMSAPAPEEQVVEVGSEVENIQSEETKKTKRGIYSGLGHGYGYGGYSGYGGYGHYPYYTYSLAPIYKSYGYGGLGHGYGHGYGGHYPYYSLGSHYGYGHGLGEYYW